MLTNFQKRLVTIPLIIALLYTMVIFIPSQSAFAASVESKNPGFDIVSMSKDKVVFDTNGFIEEVSVVRDKQDPDKITEVIYKRAEETKVYDIEANTEYSSLTGRTTEISAITAGKSMTRAASNWKEGATHVTKISWKDIAGVGDEISTIGELAALLVRIMAGLGIIVSNPVSAVTVLLIAIPGVLNKVMGNTPGGIKITTKDYYRSVTKNGKVYRIPSAKIIDMSLY